MIKRIVYFGSNAYIHTRKEQLLVEFADKEKKTASLPMEDIGVAIFDAPQMTISKAVLSKLLKYNAAVIICDEKHLPKGLFLNLANNSLQQEIFRYQVNASETIKKSLWQQTIQYKIKNQGLLLEAIGLPAKKMQVWSKKVKSGDPENVEGRAAAYYWFNVFDDILLKFRRRRFGSEPNSMLNYGYAILRAVVARNIVASGLMPTFGIHHHNKYNAYALADDIMEPYRPYVDWIVRDILEKYYEENPNVNTEDYIANKPQAFKPTPFVLNTEFKKMLLKIPLIDTVMGGSVHPLQIAVRHTTASLAACFRKEKRKLEYPTFTSF